jgi:predicted ATP-grasp superfamily ATP-dependent carboligase
MKGFALLVDTLGMYPDANAARYALTALGKYLNLNIDLSKLDATADKTKKTLESFGLIRNIAEEKKKEEQQLRWFI